MEWQEISDLISGVFTFQIFKINETPVTLTSVFLLVAVFVAFIIGSRIFSKVILKRIFTRLKVQTSTQYTLNQILHYVFLFVGAFVAFQFIGVDLSGLMVIFGLMSVGIGLGLQNLTSNFVSGLILLFERPIKVGDRIIVGDVEGDVMEIKFRSTIIRTVNNVDIIVPNANFTDSNVVNWSHGDSRIRVDIAVGVSYGSDLDTVMACLLESAKENKDALETPPPCVLHTGFGDSAWDMQLRVWIDNAKDHPFVRSDIHCRIIRKFRERGVEIPFPQRDIHIISQPQASVLESKSA